MAGALCGTLAAFCALILALAVCELEPGGVGGIEDAYLGLIVCVTFGPALGIALAHACFRRAAPQQDRLPGKSP